MLPNPSLVLAYHLVQLSHASEMNAYMRRRYLGNPIKKTTSLYASVAHCDKLAT